MGLLCTGSPRVRLTPNGIVHMGLLSTSPGGRARRKRNDPPQQRRAMPMDSTMHSLGGPAAPRQWLWCRGAGALTARACCEQPGHGSGQPGRVQAGRPPRSPAPRLVSLLSGGRGLRSDQQAEHAGGGGRQPKICRGAAGRQGAAGAAAHAGLCAGLQPAHLLPPAQDAAQRPGRCCPVCQ